mgnify:CR=1 FL=1
MYQLVTIGGWRFLADDLTIISHDGTIHTNPNPIAVYPYNLKGLPEIKKNFLALQSFIGRFQWYLFQGLFGEKGATRRVSPVKLLGNSNIAKIGILEEVVSLVRWDQPNFEIRQTTIDELATCATSTILAEIRQFRYEYNAWNSIPGCDLFPKSWEIAKSTNQIFTEAFAGRKLSVLCIPQHASPSELYSALSKHLL